MAALRKWREKNGSNATYRRLAIAFNNAGRNDLVEVVCKLLGGSHTAATKKGDDTKNDMCLFSFLLTEYENCLSSHGYEIPLDTEGMLCTWQGNKATNYFPMYSCGICWFPLHVHRAQSW